MPRLSSPTRPLLKLHGYDFALLPSAIAISTVEFANDFHKADVVAVAYGVKHWDVSETHIPTITLLARSSEHLANVFKQFEQWTSLSDGDAVELTFIYLSSGGYLLSLGPEPRRLEQRCLGFDRTSRPIIASVTWIKEMTTVHPALRQFQKYCGQLVSPFFLDGACYLGLNLDSTPDPMLVKEIPTLRNILKFSVEHINEADVKENTQAWVALNTRKHKITSTMKRTGEKDAKRFLLETSHVARREVLGRHFPITLERVRTTKSLQSIGAKLAEKGLRTWQFEQAVCNLVLSLNLTKGKPYYEGIPKKHIDSEIIRGLQNRYEEADGNVKGLLRLTEAQIVTQALEDAKVLLAKAGSLTKKQDLASILSALERRHLLEPHPA